MPISDGRPVSLWHGVALFFEELEEAGRLFLTNKQ